MMLSVEPFVQGKSVRVKIRCSRSDHNSKSFTGSMFWFSQHFNICHGSRRGFLLALECYIG
jgi:hypothetical protein